MCENYIAQIAFVFRHKYNYFTIFSNIISKSFKIVIYKNLTLYPRFLLLLVKINIIILDFKIQFLHVKILDAIYEIR